MAIKLGALIIELTAKADAFTKGMKDAKDLAFTSSGEIVASLEKIGTAFAKLKFENGAQIARSLEVIGSVAAGTAVGVASALAVIVEKSTEAAAKMYELSQATGVNVSTLSAFSYVAKQSGVDNETMAKGLERLSKNAFESADGTGKAAKAFQALGVSVTDSSGRLRPVEELIGDVAEKFGNMQDGSTKTALAMELFGRSGAALIPILNRGKDGIADLTKEAQRLGLVLDADTAEKAKRVEEAFTRMRAGAQGIGIQITAGMLPALENLAEALTNTGDKGEAWKTLGEDIGNALRFMALMANSAAKELAQVALVNEKLKQLFGQSKPEDRAYWESLIHQADLAADRINGITQGSAPLSGPRNQAPPPLPGAGTKEKTDAFAATLDRLNAIAARAAQEGLDPLSKALLNYNQQITEVANLQTKANQTITDLTEREILARTAAQTLGHEVVVNGEAFRVTGTAIQGLYRELDILIPKLKEAADKSVAVTSNQQQLAQLLDIISKTQPKPAQVVLANQFRAGAENFFQDFQKAANDTAHQVYEAFARSFERIGDTLAEFVATGKANFKQLWQSIEFEFARIIINGLIAKGLAELGKGLEKIGAAIGGRFGGALSGLGGALQGKPDGSPNNPFTVRFDSNQLPLSVKLGGSSGGAVGDAVTTALDAIGIHLPGLSGSAPDGSAGSPFHIVDDSASGGDGGDGGGSGGLFGLLGSIFGGGRATGGDVMPNRAYIVGERRPELFVPRTAGTIVPSLAGAGGDTYSFNFSFPNGDHDTMRNSAHQTANTILAALSRAGRRK